MWVTREKVDAWAYQYYTLCNLSETDPRGTAPPISCYFNFDQQKWVEATAVEVPKF